MSREAIELGGRLNVVRRAENVRVYYLRDAASLILGTHKIQLEVGRREYVSNFRVTKAQFRQMEADSQSQPVHYLTVGDKAYWRFQDKWYTDVDNLAADDIHALLITRADAQAMRLSRARTIAAMEESRPATQRQSIPAEVRQLVWKRDGGACRECGATAELQFDHVIPVAVGGSNDAGNLQVLCGPCNRRKGAAIV